jgi:dienelactone hydrolase
MKERFHALAGLALCGALLLHRVADTRAGETNSTVTAPNASVAPLWGRLLAGPYLVGFERVFRFDASRTWHVTRHFAGNYAPDQHGRPVQLNIWYPSSSGATGGAMKFSDYEQQAAPEEFSTFNVLMNGRNRLSAESSVPSSQLEALRTAQMNARLNEPPAVGRFPVVLYAGGLNADINSNFVLAEYLASHGYVVASISLVGPTDETPSLDRAPSDVETVVRDLEFALGLLAERENVDRTRVAVMGHSLGAVEAAALGLRHGNVLAVVALDGTYGFKGSAEVLTNSYGYAPNRMRAAFLDLRRAQGEQDADLDLGPIFSFRYADRTLVQIRHMHHSDFTSFAMIASRFNVPIKTNYVNTGWNRETARRGFEDMCGIVLGFLETKVKTNAPAANSQEETVLQNSGIVWKHIEAQCAPPGPRESLALARKSGIGGLEAVLEKCAGDQPPGSCVDSGLFNTFGYQLLGQGRVNDALTIFETAAWAHPASANAQDSLADALFAAGEDKRARAAVQRAIELAPTDPTIQDAARESFIAEEKRRLP